MILKFRKEHIGNMEKGRKGEVRDGEVRGGVQAGRETLRGDGEGRKRKASLSSTSEYITLEDKEPSIVRNTLCMHTHVQPHPSLFCVGSTATGDRTAEISSRPQSRCHQVCSGEPRPVRWAH